VAGWEVDAYWPSHRLIVELDGWSYHRSRQAFERDRRKDADLTAAGHRVIRITSRRLAHEPHAVTAQLAALLATTPA
jgi:very-short-patch-repair endonuclease